MVVAATIITIVEYTFDVSIPDETPTPATINPTSPLDIIPIPTRIPCALFFKNKHAGKPHPNSLVIIAITMIIELNNNISKLTS